jgi:hypothetical protein
MALTFLTFATKKDCARMAIAVRVWLKSKAKERLRPVAAAM